MSHTYSNGGACPENGARKFATGLRLDNYLRNRGVTGQENLVNLLIADKLTFVSELNT
jgi:hypothetical protein